MLRRVARTVALVILVAFIGTQFVPVHRTNPPVDSAQTVEHLAAVPPDVKAIFDRSCRDCHSNETRWPAYGYVAPMSWMLVRDVEEGREHLNLSEWGGYDADSQRDVLVEVCRQVRRGNMPLKRYTLIHSSAKLKATDVETLCNWTNTMRRSLPPE
jgi:hypothetical protein